MDYSFYLRKIAQLPTDLIVRLSQFAVDNKNIESKVSYFGDGVDKDLCSYVISSKKHDIHNIKIFQETVSHFNYLLPFNNLTAVEFNWLALNGNVHEHTDQSSNISDTGINHHYGHTVSHWHTLHISLYGNALYEFKRIEKQKFTGFRMNSGECYLFNNYCRHRVINDSDTLRLNVIMHFYDPKWNIKQNIYRTLKIEKGFY